MISSRYLDIPYFKCPSCKNYYDKKERTPVKLSCAHRMCRFCAQNGVRCQLGYICSRPRDQIINFDFHEDLQLRDLQERLKSISRERYYVCYISRNKKKRIRFSSEYRIANRYICPCCDVGYINDGEQDGPLRICQTYTDQLDLMKTDIKLASKARFERLFVCLNDSGAPKYGYENSRTKECKNCHSTFCLTSREVRVCSKIIEKYFTEMVLASRRQVPSTPEVQEKEGKGVVETKQELPDTNVSTDSFLNEETVCVTCDKKVILKNSWVCFTCDPLLDRTNEESVDSLGRRILDVQHFCGVCSLQDHVDIAHNTKRIGKSPNFISCLQQFRTMPLESTNKKKKNGKRKSKNKKKKSTGFGKCFSFRDYMLDQMRQYAHANFSRRYNCVEEAFSNREVMDKKLEEMINLIAIL